MLADARRAERGGDHSQSSGARTPPSRDAGTRASPAVARSGLTLRFALLGLLVPLLLFAVGSITIARTYTDHRTTAELEDRFFLASSTTIANETRLFFQPGPSILRTMQVDAGSGELDIANSDTLATYLASRVRNFDSVTWVSYSDDATGRFTGTWRRDDGAIIYNHSSPVLNNGTPQEFVMREDGTLEPYSRPVRSGYDPRKQPFYLQAVASSDVVWTQPYLFNEGRYGISAALALRDRATGRLRGVFTVDFSLDYLSVYLTQLSRKNGAGYVVLGRDRTILARSETWSESIARGISHGGADAIPGGIGTLGAGDSRSFVVTHNGVRFAGALEAFENTGGLNLVSGVFMPEDEFLQGVYDNQRQSLLLGALVLALSILLGAVVAERIAGPLRLIATDLGRIGRFEITATGSPQSYVKEVAVVGEAVDRMKASLRSFSRYVPVQLIHELVSSGEEARLGGETRMLTIYFSDIEGFTNTSERQSPAEVVEQLGEYFEAMSEVIEHNQGIIDKFMGDGIVALFNAPREIANHADWACRAALDCQQRLERLRPNWSARNRPTYRIRIGLHSGEALVGNIGAPGRFAYTVIGDVVNLSSRLESLNKQYGTYILASDDTRQAAGPDLEWRTLDRVAVTGRSEGTLVSELLGVRGAPSPGLLAASDRYERALEAYFEGDFTAAATGFRAAAVLRPWDKAALLMEYRAERFAQNPPPPPWDGIFRAVEK